MNSYFQYLNYRNAMILGAAACVFAMLFAVIVLQKVLGLEPCPMCIFQRVAMSTAALFFVLGALHNPKGWGRFVYAELAFLAAAIGAGIAARHVWLQNLPPDQVPACGPTLGYLLNFLPLTEVVTMILKGDGNCAKIEGQWLGITLPGWTLVSFVGLALWALLAPLWGFFFKGVKK
jgi:disulfide bond formation protein DsbB